MSEAFTQNRGAEAVMLERRLIAWLIVLGLALRLIVHFASSGILWPDSFAYYRSAEAIGKRLDFTVHEVYRTPGYPAFLGMILASFGFNDVGGFAAILIQRLLGIASSVILFKTLKNFFSIRIAFAASLLFSLNSVQVYYEGVVQTEALFVFIFLSFINLFFRSLRQESLGMVFAAGILLGALTLTRPIAQLLILPSIIWFFAAWGLSRRSLVKAAFFAAAYLLLILPWCASNKDVYGFFGISVDRGINLFHRVIDIDRLNAPETTKHKTIRSIVSAAQARNRGVYFEVHKFLRTKKKKSAVETDAIMKGFAIEALETDPWRMPIGTARMFTRIFFHSRVSPHFCGDAFGPYLCARTTRSQALPAFPNAPIPGFSSLRAMAKFYFERLVLPLRVITILAILGVVGLWRERKFNLELLFSMLLILYFTGITAVFNRAEDRFRLPIDGLFLALACFGAVWICRMIFSARPPTAPSR